MTPQNFGVVALLVLATACSVEQFTGLVCDQTRWSGWYDITSERLSGDCPEARGPRRAYIGPDDSYAAPVCTYLSRPQTSIDRCRVDYSMQCTGVEDDPGVRVTRARVVQTDDIGTLDTVVSVTLYDADGGVMCSGVYRDVAVPVSAGTPGP